MRKGAPLTAYKAIQTKKFLIRFFQDNPRKCPVHKKTKLNMDIFTPGDTVNIQFGSWHGHYKGAG